MDRVCQPSKIIHSLWRYGIDTDRNPATDPEVLCGAWDIVGSRSDESQVAPESRRIRPLLFKTRVWRRFETPQKSYGSMADNPGVASGGRPVQIEVDLFLQPRLPVEHHCHRRSRGFIHWDIHEKVSVWRDIVLGSEAL
jgi:hypothetical protein